jgi:hypothetical protein
MLRNASLLFFIVSLLGRLVNVAGDPQVSSATSTAPSATHTVSVGAVSATVDSLLQIILTSVS